MTGKQIAWLGICALALSPLLPASLWAQDANAIPDAKRATLNCVETMQSDEDWNICLGLMFAPCASQEVGSEGHVSCLFDEREAWRTIFDAQFDDLTDRLNATGTTELANLIGQWTGYVANKCNAVAQDKEGAFADAAQYGCEISEYVGVSAELRACKDGLSTAPYCQLKG